jgi:hypothetical protein
VVRVSENEVRTWLCCLLFRGVLIAEDTLAGGFPLIWASGHGRDSTARRGCVETKGGCRGVHKNRAFGAAAGCWVVRVGSCIVALLCCVAHCQNEWIAAQAEKALTKGGNLTVRDKFTHAECF